MGLILTAAAGLGIWIVLWSLGLSGFDGMLIVIAMVMIALVARNLLSSLPRRRG